MATPDQEGLRPPYSAKRPKWQNFNMMIPNIMTVGALSAGMTAIRFAFEGRWERALLAILVASILDALDGRIARILKGSSRFGAELDSLSDFICFGIAPAIILYLWAMEGVSRFGWILALLFSVCCALRLARFNTMMEDEDRPAWSRHFFSGVPSPAGAGLVLLPMMLFLQTDSDFFRSPGVVSFFLISVSALLVSPIHTFSFKKIKVRHNLVLPIMLVVGLITAGLVSATWFTLSVILLVYLGSFPFSYRAYRRFLEKDIAMKAEEKPDNG